MILTTGNHNDRLVSLAVSSINRFKTFIIDELLTFENKALGMKGQCILCDTYTIATDTKSNMKAYKWWSTCYLCDGHVF